MKIILLHIKSKTMVSAERLIGAIANAVFDKRRRTVLLLVFLVVAVFLLMHQLRRTESMVEYLLFKSGQFDQKVERLQAPAPNRCGDALYSPDDAPPDVTTPALTLFSTWGNRGDLDKVRQNTLRNWAQLKPFVQPLLFTDDASMATSARQAGWHVLPVSHYAIGIPVLSTMYRDAMARFNTSLYGYANGDILFTPRLQASLKAVLSEPSLALRARALLATGVRTNTKNLTRFEARSSATIRRAAAKRGRLMHPNGADYFIVNRHFQWDKFPDLVVARPRYDRFIVRFALERCAAVVDLTRTVLAVHQTTSAGNAEHQGYDNLLYNDQVIREVYGQGTQYVEYEKGSTLCSQWLTTLREKSANVTVQRRTEVPLKCLGGWQW